MSGRGMCVFHAYKLISDQQFTELDPFNIRMLFVLGFYIPW